MKRFIRFLARHKKALILSLVLVAVGACFRWEVAEIDDATTVQNVPGLVHEGVPEEVFFALTLDGHIPQGIVEFHAGFKACRSAT